MSHSVPFRFQQKKVHRKDPDTGKNVYSAIASTDALDRDQEVLVPKGVILDQFMKNPVMLFIHDYRQVPVGRVLDINVDDEKIKIDFEFAESTLGQELEGLYKSNFMSAFSVGFYPRAFTPIDDETPEQLSVEVADGSKFTLDLTKYKSRPHNVISKWELLEVSPVPIPSNPEALLLRAKDELVRKFVGGGGAKSAGQLLEHQIGARLKALTTDLKTFWKELENESALERAVPIHETEILKDVTWDAAGASGKLAAWASEDGSGDKEHMDWGKYAEGFAWVDINKADSFSSYRFPHHTVVDGKLVAVWRGVTAAMADLLSSKGKIPEEDVRSVYLHLASHYGNLDLPAPDLDKEYNEAQLKAIAEGKEIPVEVEDEGGQGDKEGDVNNNTSVTTELLKTFVETNFKQTNDVLVELEETMRVRMNVVVNRLDEMQQQLKELSDSLNNHEGDPTGGEGENGKSNDEGLGEQVDALSKMMQDLKAGLVAAN